MSEVKSGLIIFDRKQYTNDPTYLTKNDDGKNGGWTGMTVVSE